MEQRSGLVTLQGNPLVLLGPELQPGDKAPDFSVVGAELKPVHLSDFAGKVKVISVVPSLDTPVCELQTKRFNQEAAKLADGVAVLTLSVDLPFAQGRFCSTHGIEGVRVLSDYQQVSFGKAYGVLVDGLRLLARAIFIVDAHDVIRYVEIVPDISEHPDYDKALAVVATLT